MHALAQIREEYWIPQGRVKVKIVLSKCVVCLNKRDLPFGYHLCLLGLGSKFHAPPSFQFVGLDMGPIYVKHETELRKALVCLFIFLTVRAMHLEWELDLTAIQFRSCFRRFIS